LCLRREVLLQLGCELFSICIAQVTNLGVTAILQRGIEMRDQSPQTQAVTLVAADQNAVGSRIGDQGRCDLGTVGARLLRQRGHNSDNIGS